jgi:hypothetical protein
VNGWLVCGDVCGVNLDARAGGVSVLDYAKMRDAPARDLEGEPTSKLVDTTIDFYHRHLIVYATFLPTFPTPLPTMLTTIPPGSSASSLIPHPLRPNALKSLAS